MKAKKHQWFVWILMIIEVLLYVFTQQEMGISAVCGLVFVAIFALDTKNVFYDLDIQTKIYFYIQCVAMCVMVLIYGFVLAMDHGSTSFYMVKRILNILQIVNILTRILMTHLLIEKEYHSKLDFNSCLMLVSYYLFTDF